MCIRDRPKDCVLSGNVEIPRDTANGDYAANHAMAGAKTLHMAPKKIAETLLGEMDLDGSYFTKCEIAGPGFMNFFLGGKWYEEVIGAVDSLKDDYGRCDVGHGEKAVSYTHLDVYKRQGQVRRRICQQADLQPCKSEKSKAHIPV